MHHNAKNKNHLTIIFISKLIDVKLFVSAGNTLCLRISV